MGKKPNRVVRYRIENEKFLEQMAQEEGIVALESGILIRELQKGNGLRSPQLKSTVYVHYVGRLIDGTVFDSTEAVFRHVSGWMNSLSVGRLPFCACMRGTLSGSIFLPDTAMAHRRSRAFLPGQPWILP